MNQSESSLCRVFLVDDDLLVLDDLRELIAWEAEGFEIIGTAGNGEQALAQLARTPADLVFVDIEMPRLTDWTLSAGCARSIRRCRRCC